MKASEDRYRRLFETAMDGILLLNSDTAQIEDVNPFLIKLLNYSHEEFLGKKLWEVGPFKDVAQSKEMFQEIQTKGYVRYDDLPLKTKAGFTIAVEFVSNSYDVGGIEVIQCNIRDIRTRKAAELALKTSNAQLQLLETCVARLNDIVLITEAEPFSEPGPRIVFVNDAFVRRTGFTREEVIGKSPQMLQGPKTDRAELDRIRAALELWEPVCGELLNYTKSGEEFWIELDIVPVADTTGLYTHWVAVARDVTERKQNLLDLQYSLREKDALLKEVHHRVKNNLQVITSLLRLEAGRSLVADTKEVLGYMRGRIRTMAQLHESLYRSGTFASVDLGAYLSQVAKRAFKTQELHRDTVRLTLNLGSVQSDMDQAQAAGLLLNELISNCLKHGFPEGQAGEVSVALQPANDQDKPADGSWRLLVSDTGLGLPPDFEEKRNASLGLQLVTDLSYQLGGTLESDSVAGAGARFSVVFTVQAPAALVMPP